MNLATLQKHIIFFDGICAFCNKTVIRIVKRDINNIFYFAPLQSELGAKALEEAHLPKDYLSGIVYYNLSDNTYYTGGIAAKKIILKLYDNIFWSRLLVLIPNWLFSFGYAIIAKVRYGIWGEANEACQIELRKTCQERLII